MMANMYVMRAHMRFVGVRTKMTKIGDLYNATSPPIWKYSFTLKSLWTVSVYYEDYDKDVNEYVCVLYNDNRKTAVIWGIGESIYEAIVDAINHWVTLNHWATLSYLDDTDAKKNPFYGALQHLSEGVVENE